MLAGALQKPETVGGALACNKVNLHMMLLAAGINMN